MKRFSSIKSILIVLAVVYWSFADLKPSLPKDDAIVQTGFSLYNAKEHLKNITVKPHYVGSEGHKQVQNYLVDELKKMGFQVDIQIQTVVNKKWFAGTTTENIVARLKGSSEGKALLLLSHYDSSPHSSLGASDDGAGVVTILEAVRALLATNRTPKNDVIILISDAEELGLLGAQAFVEHHSWAKDVGLVLNFEARGSGGSSYMLMETNGKNSKLLSEFLAAKPNYPAANSLMYSVYKKLPNDTDLTVFRENGDINGFNFAFIGDHFDYHTAQDSYERLDRESLLHQADYLTTCLQYFANSDLSDFSSDEDYVYVNFPFSSLLSYPFSWITPMLIIAVVLFIILLFFGFSLKRLTLKGVLKGFIPSLGSLILCGGISYYLWKLILIIHPGYTDILHGFTYNGYTYIAAFTFLNLFILFKIYSYFNQEEKVANLLIAPIFIWLIINFLISESLKGAAFFIIPVFIALLILAISIFMKIESRSNRILCTILSIPTIYMFSPMVKMFPVGLGLKMLLISGVILALVFGLMIFTFLQKNSKWMLKLSAVFAIIFFGLATYNSGFSTENKKPNSLVYIQNSDDKTAYFGTYNNTLDEFTNQIFSDDSKQGSIKNAETKSKYNTRFKYSEKTDFRNISSSDITISLDTIIGNNRIVELVITPKRKVNKIELITNNKIKLSQFKVNDALVNSGKDYEVKKGTLSIYHMGNSDEELVLSFSMDKNQTLDAIVNEISYDLLTNENFKIAPRSADMIPMPFVTNDAIIVSKKLKL